MRPAPGGVSVGHFAITAGILGCFARGRTAPRSNRVLIRSNNHVLANSNAGPVGANILQPGHFDGGQNPADRIAILEQLVPINFAGGVNFVDCATGWCWSALVRYPFLMYQVRNSPGILPRFEHTRRLPGRHECWQDRPHDAAYAWHYHGL